VIFFEKFARICQQRLRLYCWINTFWLTNCRMNGVEESNGRGRYCCAGGLNKKATFDQIWSRRIFEMNDYISLNMLILNGASMIICGIGDLHGFLFIGAIVGFKKFRLTTSGRYGKFASRMESFEWGRVGEISGGDDDWVEDQFKWSLEVGLGSNSLVECYFVYWNWIQRSCEALLFFRHHILAVKAF